MSLDKAAFNMIHTIYSKLPETIAATGATWLLCRSVSQLGLDARTGAVFTAAAAVFGSGIDGFLKNEYIEKTHARFLTAHLGLTYLAKGVLKLDLPLYKQFGKAYTVATAMLFAANWGSFQLQNLMKPRKRDYQL